MQHAFESSTPTQGSVLFGTVNGAVGKRIFFSSPTSSVENHLLINTASKDLSDRSAYHLLLPTWFTMASRLFVKHAAKSLMRLQEETGRPFLILMCKNKCLKISF